MAKRLPKVVTLTGRPFVAHVDQLARPERTFDLGGKAFTESIKSGGYAYNPMPHLNRYVYQSYGHWYCVYALTKTDVRKAKCGGIDEIHQIPNLWLR